MRYKNIFILFLFVSIFSSSLCSEVTIRIVTEEWAPYNYVNNDELTGFSVEILNEIMLVLGKTFPIEILPGVRSKYLLSTEPNVFMLSVFRTSERENLYKWIGPISTGSIFFYKLSDNPVQINSIEDAKNVATIACRYAGIIPDLLRFLGFSNLETSATDSIQIYRKLLLGRCDLAISDTDCGVRYNLEKIGASYSSLTKIPLKIFESDLYIACNKNTPDEIIKQWQDAYAIVQKSEKYQEIYRKYF